MGPLRVKWEKSVQGKSLPWYAEEKLASGAFSSLLGLEFSDEDSAERGNRVWRAVALGDTCLVQVRNDKVVAAFPLQDSGSFTTRPVLLSSLLTAPDAANDALLKAVGHWGCDDVFFMMTDALSCWFFKEMEAGRKPWRIFRDLHTQGQTSFKAMVDSLRASGAMKNDDVTLVRIDIWG
jgi:hypothetical protein